MSTGQSVQPAPTTYNPASKWLNLRNVAIVLIIFGLIVSGYLSYVKLTDVQMACPGEGSGFDCGAVQNSIYAELPPRSGIAIAWLGFATYLVIFGLVLFEKRIPFLREWGIPMTFGIVLFAFLFSAYLVYVQAVLIKAFCAWCLMHEANMTLLFGVYIIRLIKFLNKPDVNNV